MTLSRVAYRIILWAVGAAVIALMFQVYAHSQTVHLHKHRPCQVMQGDKPMAPPESCRRAYHRQKRLRKQGVFTAVESKQKEK